MNIIPVNEHNQNGAKASSALLAIGSFEIQPTGLVIHGQPDIYEWIAAGEVFKRLETAIQWVIGDWLNYGERRYGEMSAQATSEREYDRFKDYAWVSRKVERSLRNDNLSWSHHKEVAPMEPDQQKHYLDMAERGGLSVRALRSAIKPSSPVYVYTAQVIEYRGAVMLEIIGGDIEALVGMGDDPVTVTVKPVPLPRNDSAV